MRRTANPKAFLREISDQISRMCDPHSPLTALPKRNAYGGGRRNVASFLSGNLEWKSYFAEIEAEKSYLNSLFLCISARMAGSPEQYKNQVRCINIYIEQ